jgi:ribonuclease J
MITEKNHQWKQKKKNVPYDNDALLQRVLSDKDEGMLFIAASGVEQIGMNLNIFGYKGKFIIVDVGISFTDLGSGVMLPSTNILHDIGPENILAYVITHGHEDHIGALWKFMEEINKPIYSTKFTMCLIEEKLKEHMIKNRDLKVVEVNQSFKIGEFEVLFSNITHSIPDSNHIIIKTPNGSVFHTGDWKFDSNPVLGLPPDMEYLKHLGEKYNITALINDSTNAQEFKKIGTELEAQEGLRHYIRDKDNVKNRITVTCFSSNLARIKSLQIIAKEAGRTIVLVGRSLLKMVGAGIKLGLLKEDNIILDAKKVAHLELAKTLYVCTGSQGEMNSVLQRAALGLHPNLKLTNEDIVIFSSRIIPGNEKKIAEIKNEFLHRGMKIVDHNTPTEDMRVIHVSGHPGQDDIINLVRLVKPKVVIPVHGDLIHLYAVGELMKKINHPCLLPKGNGTVFRIHDKDGVEILGKLDTHTDVIDGNSYYPIDDDIFRQRALMNEHGLIVIIINRDKKHFFFNYGAVNKDEWEKSLRRNLVKLIEKTDFIDIEGLRNDISYWLYKKYKKNPLLIVYDV